MAHKRPAQVWEPCWETDIKKFASNHIRANRWRCDSIDDFEDLLQDAYLIFHKVAERYPLVRNPRHFMSLFKRSLTNKIHDKASLVSKRRSVHVETSCDAAEIGASYSDDIGNEGYLAALLAEAPDEVRVAILTLHSKADEFRATPKGRENFNMRIRRVLGKDNSCDYLTAIKKYLKEE